MSITPKLCWNCRGSVREASRTCHDETAEGKRPVPHCHGAEPSGSFPDKTDGDCNEVLAVLLRAGLARKNLQTQLNGGVGHVRARARED